MTMLLESLRSALLSIRAHGLRSFLTTLGIIIGVASVIAVVSLVQGLEHSITSQFEGLGGNSLTVRSDTSFKEAIQGKRNHLTLLDFERITHYIDDIEDVTPVFVVNIGGDRMLRYQGQSAFTQVVATRASWQDSRQIYAGKGRFVTNNDDRSRRRVVVIGETVRENLKLPDNPIGEFIEMGGEWFKVVGVTEERGEMFGFSQDDFAVIPFATGMAMVEDPLRQDIQISFNVRRIEDIEPIKDRVSALLRQLHKLKPGERNDFKVQTASQLTESFEAVIGTVTVVLGGIVSVSLLVGGIGIMNIMLANVLERKREIGLLRALGARQRDITRQFLREAAVICVTGALAGIVFGGALAYLIAWGADWQVAWAPIPVLAAVIACTAVGLAFGVYPARQAARLDPIAALRTE